MSHSAIEYGVAMHDAFTGGANVFMAYDWVYPPRDSGEALIHVDWGKDYTLTKPYYLFRQWAEPLKPGMHLTEVAVAGKAADGLKATAFVAPDNNSLVVHVVNTLNQETAIILKLTGKFATATAADRKRTSATEDVVALPALTGTAGSLNDTVPAQSIVTYRFENIPK